MMRVIGTAMAVMLATAAAAQSGGSTYPQGSNLPQRTAGELAPKPAAQTGASAGATSRTVHGKAASRKGAKPHSRTARH